MDAHSQSSWKRTFLTIFAGQAFSLLGSSAVNFALVIWLTQTTGSAAVLAYASIAALLPQAVVGPFAGPYIDRWSRRATMISADAFIALTSVGLIAVFATGTPPVWVVIVFIGLRSVGAAFHTPASQAAIPMYVPQNQLLRVAGWNQMLHSGVAMTGPVLGAFMMGVLPLQYIIATDVLGAALAIGSLLLVRIPHPERATSDDQAPRGVLPEMAAGWRELTAHRGLLALAIVISVVAFIYIPVSALFPLMTLGHFSGTPIGASIVELAFGGGMLLSSSFIGVLGAKLPGARLTAASMFLLGATLAASGLLPGTAFPAFVVLCLFMGISAPGFFAPINAMLQSQIDPSKLGRVMAFYGTMTLIATPFGLAVAGPLAERVGVATWFSISGVLIVLLGVYCVLSPTIRGLDPPPAEDETAEEA